MNLRLRLFQSRRLALHLLACHVAFSALPAAAQSHTNPTHLPALRIELRDAAGLRVAATDGAGASSAELNLDRAYQPGDRILITGAQRIAVQLDAQMPVCDLYLPGAPANSPHTFSFAVPLGRAETEEASSYAPSAFTGASHRITVRAVSSPSAYRNLALNPCDQQLGPPVEAPAQAFPHASSNSIFKNWPDFRERNAIDGNAQNCHHGVWPYQSWGPDQRADLWWKVDFGRPVPIDKLRLMIRADFPHDSYWQSVQVEFSDGVSLPLHILHTADFQEFTFPAHRTSSIRLTRLVPADPARWCSLVELEAWGSDLP